MTTITDVVQSYYEAREAYEALKADSDRAYRTMKALENEVVDQMLDEGQKTVSFVDGTSVSLRKQFSVSVVKDNMHMIRDWLMEWQGDDSDFVEEVVSKPALLDLVRSKVESGELDESEVPEFLNLNTRPGISVRGWNNRGNR